MKKLKDLILGNYIPVILTAILMWGGWVTMNLRNSDDYERQNKAQWEQIARMKEIFSNNQLLELKKQVSELRDDNRELRDIFLRFIAGHPLSKKERQKLENSLF